MDHSSKTDVQVIHDIRERTMHAENNGEADFSDSVCTDDIVVLPPNMPSVTGRAAAVAFMRDFLGQFDLQIQYVSEETEVHGDIALDRGTYSQTLTPKSGGPPIPEQGNFLWLYSRSSEGTWKISRVMWNASGYPPGQS